MSAIGKINKPEVSSYRNKKKVYFVRNLYLPKNASEQFTTIFTRYWNEVDEHLAKLEIAGKISKIFCESIYMTGEKSMQVLSAMNPRLEQIVKEKIDAGGQFIPLESKEIFGVYIDWYNCLAHVRTPRVHETIHKFLDDTIKERFEYIESVLRENIAEGESAMLIMRDEDREFLKVPDDIEIFLITPTAHDDLQQYIRGSKSETEYWRT